MICADCGVDLHATGIRQHARITGIADAHFNPATGRFAWSGTAECEWDDEEHLYYVCAVCGTQVTSDQADAIAFES